MFRLLKFLFLLLLCNSLAFAADRGCGVDTDQSGAVDTLCPAPDQDNDGYLTTGSATVNGAQSGVDTITVDSGHTLNKRGAIVSIGANQYFVKDYTATTITLNDFVTGATSISVSDNDSISAVLDCDDTNHYIYPGIDTISGCSAGNYRTCQNDGTYTSCASLSSYTCHTSGSTYFLDDAETDCTGDGSYGDPENWLCLANTGLGGYHALSAGNCAVFKCGTYSGGVWGTNPNLKQFYQNNIDGTSSNKIKIKALPGCAWWEAGIGSGVVIEGGGSFNPSYPGTAHNSVEGAFHLISSDHIEISGMEIKNLGTGFGTAGIHTDGSSNVRIHNNYVHDIDGEEDSNTACIKLRGSGATSVRVDHNLVKDCYERTATTGDSGWNSQNNSGIRGMDVDELLYLHNVSVNTANATYGLDFKHGISTAVGNHVYGNIIIGSGYAGVAIDAIPNSTIRANFLYDVCSLNPTSAVCPGAFSYIDLSGSTHEHKNVFFEYNTVVKAPAFHALNAAWTGTGGNIYSFKYNVVSDDHSSSYSTDNSANGFYNVAGYGSNAQRDDVLARGISDYNCFYNENSQTLRFSFFEATSGGWGPAGNNGQAYSGLGAWQAIYDTHSYNENPSFDSYGRATSTNCGDKGWLLSSESGGGGGPGGGGGGVIGGNGRSVILRRRFRR